MIPNEKLLHYKGYAATGSVNFISQEVVIHPIGLPPGLTESLRATGESVSEAANRFVTYVDTYLCQCALKGVEPVTPKYIQERQKKIVTGEIQDPETFFHQYHP